MLEASFKRFRDPTGRMNGALLIKLLFASIIWPGHLQLEENWSQLSSSLSPRSLALVTPLTTNFARVRAVSPIWEASVKNAVFWRSVRTIVKYWKVSDNLNINHNRIFAVLIFYIQIGHQISVQQSRTIFQTNNISYCKNLKVLGCGNLWNCQLNYQLNIWIFYNATIHYTQ